MNQGPPKKPSKKTPKQSATPPDMSAFAGDKAVELDESAILKIVQLADRLSLVNSQIADAQKDMEVLTNEKLQLELATIPDLMTSLGLEQYKTTSGLTITVEPFIQASLPAAGAIEKAAGEAKAELEERLKSGLQYLRDHNAEGLIKSQVIVAFGKGEDTRKAKFFEAIVGKGYTAISAETVHPQTLVSYIKEQLEQGVDIPFETFKIYSGKKAKVKQPR